jgi:hypothetical protein
VSRWPTLPSCNVKFRSTRLKMRARAHADFGLHPYATMACVACRSACTSRLWLLFPVSGKGTLDSGRTPSRDAAVNDRSDEETDEPLIADHRNYYKVEKWTKDGDRIERMLYAGNNLDKARDIFVKAIKHRPRIRLTIRQRTRVLQQWPV